MEKTVFENIVSQIPVGSMVSLQGEGESVLHPDFWDLVSAVRAHGCRLFTITNGTLISRHHLDSVLKNFGQIGVSLDSIDEGTDTGRYGQTSLLRRVEALSRLAGSNYVVVHITYYGQDIAELINRLRILHIGYIIQKLQTKPDYVKGSAYLNRLGSLPREPHRSISPCRFVLGPMMRYYNVDGREFPCCFIKDDSNYTSLSVLMATFRRGGTPDCCQGCRELTAGKMLKAPDKDTVT